MLAPLLSFGAGILSNMWADERQEDAQQFSAQQFATRYQTTVKDLEAAGLNPALAYSQGGGTPPSSSAVSANMPDVGASLTQSKLASAQIANIEADTENKAAQAELINAQAAAARGSAWQSLANVEKIDADVRKIKAETENIPDEGRRIRAAVNALAEQAALDAQRGETQVSIRREIEAKIRKLMAETGKVGAETKLLNFDIEAADNLGNLGRYGKEGRIVLDVIRELRR